MMFLSSLHWREPAWLLLALYPLVMLSISHALRHLRRDHYAENRLLPWARSPQGGTRRQSRVRYVATLLAWCCFAIAIAGPRTATKIYQLDSANYTEVMIVLDVSKSMSARDVLPDRLQRARLEILDFLQRAEQVRVGLSIFAAHPHLVSPLSYDKHVIQHYLAALQPGLLPTAGSNIIDALSFAVQYFDQSKTASHAILLVSDGDSADSITPEALLQVTTSLRQQGIQVYSLGVGTLTGQAVVAQSYTHRNQTQTTVSTLQRAPLQQVAQLTRGRYADISTDDSDWQQLYTQGIARLLPAASATQNRNNKILWHELYHLPLVLGFMFFILGLFNTGKTGFTHHTAAPHLALLFTVLISSVPFSADATEASYAMAYQMYQARDYTKARELFSRLPGYNSRLGEAHSYYQQGDFANARNTYIQAVLAAADDQQRATALFNLANSYFRLKEFIQAAQIYHDVLRYAPNHRAAKNNIVHAQRQQRLKAAEDALTYRPGRGPRSGRAADNLDLENTQVSLGSSTTDTDVILPVPETKPLSATKALEQAELASQQVEHDTDQHWTYRLDSIIALQSHQHSLQADNVYVWQRLFEGEEGFPAPVPVPQQIPGVSPW